MLQPYNSLEKLLGLPLFQGMSRNDLNEVIADTKLTMLKYARNKAIASEGDLCSQLFILVSGEMNVESRADDNGYSITESFAAPDMIQPERIFGMTQRYTRTFTAKTDCHIISIEKPEVVRLTGQYEIFRINLLNSVCAQMQRISRLPWRVQAKDIRHKIGRFVESRCTKPAGQKSVTIKMERLGHEIGESRLNVSRELNAMHSQGLITLSRGAILIHALEKIINS